MVQAFRESPVLIIHVALVILSVVVLTLLGLVMARSGASLRPIYWMLGLILLIIGPQFAANLYLSLGAVRASAPRRAALEQLATNSAPEVRRTAARLLFGPDADAPLVTDARPAFGDVFAGAEFAQFAVLPNGDSVLLAQFKGRAAAEKGWIAYLHQTGLNQLGGVGDTQRGYAVTRPGGDRAYVWQAGRTVGVWTGRDDAAIRQRMVAGGFAVPRRAPLAGVSPQPPAGRPDRTIPAGVAAALITLNVFVLALYYFKGAAWAGTYRARPGTTPVAAAELASRLEAINTLDLPFRIERGPQPNEFFAEWRYADAKWLDLARVRGMKRTFRIRLQLDETNRAVRATDYAASYDWSAGQGGVALEWKASLGIVFFQYEHQRVLGVQLDDQGRFKPQLGYAYTFNVKEMKSPLVETVTRAGWTWRPTIWQGPKWLRWLTES